MEIVTKTWNLVKLHQKYMEMCKTVKIFWNSSPWNTKKVWNSDLYIGEGTFYLEEPNELEYLPHKVKMQFLQMWNIVDTSIKH